MNTFEAWIAELKQLASVYDWPIDNIEDWRGFFDDGYTPREALEEDISVA